MPLRSLFGLYIPRREIRDNDRDFLFFLGKFPPKGCTQIPLYHAPSHFMGTPLVLNGTSHLFQRLCAESHQQAITASVRISANGMESQIPSVPNSKGSKRNTGISKPIPRKNTNDMAAFIRSMLWQ